LSKSYLIGVDIGIAGTKAAIFDTEGRMVAEAYEESKLRYPKPGWVEQDQEDFYRSAARRFVKTTSRIEPRPKYHQYYNNYARTYIDLIKTQDALFSKLARISQVNSWR
jgi:sugar (pentulose or hexulose) kinase